MKRRLTAVLAAIPVAAAGAFVATAVTGQGVAQRAPAPDYIEGTVTSGGKGEAGVWVIAEAKLGTAFRKIVATDRRGRFVLPQLPNATYRVWVRGYGLSDSAKVRARPGADLDIRVKKAPSKRAAARIYPANYWLSLFNPPDTTVGWALNFKGNCMLCHQVGSIPTRSLPTREAYDQGTKKAGTMYGSTVFLGRDKLLDSLADWSARIAGGETPPAPPRPKGKERNLVITQWDWGDEVHLRPRRGRHRPQQAHAERERTRVGRGHRQRLPAPHRPGEEHARRGSRSRPSAASTPAGATSGARRDRHGAGRLPDARLPRGRRGRRQRLRRQVPQPGEPPQPDAGREGPRLDHHADPPRVPRGRAGVLQGRPADGGDPAPPAARLLRPQDEEVPAHRHVLRHAPPAVRQEGPAVGER